MITRVDHQPLDDKIAVRLWWEPSPTADSNILFFAVTAVWRDVSLSYMLENALPAYAESNNFVVLYPQCQAKNNPVGDGCWDWYGAVSKKLALRQPRPPWSGWPEAW